MGAAAELVRARAACVVQILLVGVSICDTTAKTTASACVLLGTYHWQRCRGRESSSDSGSDSSSESGGAWDDIELNEYSRGSLHTVQHYSASSAYCMYGATCDAVRSVGRQPARGRTGWFSSLGPYLLSSRLMFHGAPALTPHEGAAPAGAHRASLHLRIGRPRSASCTALLSVSQLSTLLLLKLYLSSSPFTYVLTSSRLSSAAFAPVRRGGSRARVVPFQVSSPARRRRRGAVLELPLGRHGQRLPPRGAPLAHHFRAPRSRPAPPTRRPALDYFLPTCRK